MATDSRTALVTGGSRGIGAGIAKRLATGGVNVVITYSKGADAAAAVVEDIERGGGKVYRGSYKVFSIRASQGYLSSTTRQSRLRIAE